MFESTFYQSESVGKTIIKKKRSPILSSFEVRVICKFRVWDPCYPTLCMWYILYLSAVLQKYNKTQDTNNPITNTVTVVCFIIIPLLITLTITSRNIEVINMFFFIDNPKFHKLHSIFLFVYNLGIYTTLSLQKFLINFKIVSKMHANLSMINLLAPAL